MKPYMYIHERYEIKHCVILPNGPHINEIENLPAVTGHRIVDIAQQRGRV